MAQNITVAQSLLIANGIYPRNDAAVRSSDYITLARSHKGFLLCQVAIGAAVSMTLSILQATNTAGAGAKALGNNARIWLINDTTVANPVPVRQADGTSFATDTTVSSKMVIFEVDPAMLDLVNGFTSIAVQTNGSTAASFISCVALATPRSGEDQASSPRVN